MGRSILGGILGAIVLFIWMGITWMVIPWHCPTLQKFEHEESVASVVMSNTARDGIYLLPNCNNMSGHDAKAMEAMKQGPIVFAAVQRHGKNMESAKPYIMAFIIYLISAFFVTLLVTKTGNLGYKERLWFVTVFGVVAGILASFPAWNWWGFSLSFAVVGFIDMLIGWFLAGLVIAGVTKRNVTA
jgi:hypothetical protein